MAISYRNGGNGNDLLDETGNTGPVQIQGRAGDDTIRGGAGADKLYGNEGNDVLAGGVGADTLEGGAGDDIYVIKRTDLGSGKDSLLYFEGAGAAGGDVIRLTGFSAAATLTFVRQSGNDFTYLIRDGDVSGEVLVRQYSSARLVAGDYVFEGATPGGNRAPVAAGDAATVAATGARSVIITAATLLANDSDADGNALRITGFGTAAHGTLSVNANGTPNRLNDDIITYVPTAGYTGSDAFTYVLSDGTVSVTGTVNVTVLPPTTPPVITYVNGTGGNDRLDASTATLAQQVQGRAGDDTVIGGSGNDKLQGNDGSDVLIGGAGADTFTGGTGADMFVIARTDLNGGSESITDFEGAGDGGLPGGDLIQFTGFSAAATLTFVRQSGRDHIYEIRDDGFTAQLKLAYDGAARLAAGDYVFTVPSAPLNHAPIAGAISIETRTNAIVSGKLPASDVDGDAVGFSVSAGPAHGTLKLEADGSYLYAPEVGYAGGDAFRMVLDDRRGGMTETIVSIIIQSSDKDAEPWRDTQAGNGAVFVQRDGASGSFYFAADMARVVKGGVTVADWTDGGVILGVPQGDGYTLETMTGGVVASRPLAIGDVVAAAGQSNMEGWFTAAGQSRSSKDGIYIWVATHEGVPGHWVPATGAGALAFAETLRLAAPDVPVAFVTGAVGGTKLLPATNVEYWLKTGDGSLYQDTIDQLLEASHGRAALLLWNQGEADSASRVDPLLYADGMKTLFARFDAEIAPDRIVISGLAFTRGNADALRIAQASVATADGHILYVPTSAAIETTDETHLTVPARILQGTEAALAVLAAEGTAPPGIGRQSGGAGIDMLIGGLLTDILQGGGGNDTLNGGDGDDIVRGEAGGDLIVGGEGHDALSGGLDNDTIDGGAGNDDVFGDGGGDVLTGGAGGDRLDGGTGADTLSGQAGDDLYVVDNIADVVVEAADGGTDTVYGRISYTLAAFVENLIIDSVEAINATGNALANMLTGGNGANILSGMAGDDSLSGGPGSDTLLGGDGGDTLSGGSGADLMFGGNGDDIYYVEAGDTVSEAGAGGYDTVISQVAFTLPEDVEAIQLGGKSSLNATGSAGANTISGNAGSNLLDGAGGSDTVMGMAGNDTLRGGLDNDVLLGGDGGDTLIGGLGADTLTGDGSKHSADIFVFESLADMGRGVGRDVVADFDSQDIFDVRLVDANTAVAGDQAFSFIGSAAFSAAGQIRFTVVDGGVLIELNVDNNLGTDAEILLTAPLAVVGTSDFLL